MNPPPSPQQPQPADTLEKRRKQIEKAKAAHLSRQLQMRLQYARLKVDHGWQKQTLNEVENLYFHHYRARGVLRAERRPPPVAVLGEPPGSLDEDAQADIDVDPPAEGLPAQFSAAVLPLSPPQQQQHPPAAPRLAEPPLPPSAPTPAPAPQLPPYPPAPPQQQAPYPPAPPPQPTPTPAQQLPPYPPATPTPAPHHAPFPPPPAHPPAPFLPQTHSPAPYPPPAAYPPAAAGVALTYDSFWSSHAQTAGGYRAALGDTGAAFPFVAVAKRAGGG